MKKCVKRMLQLVAMICSAAILVGAVPVGALEGAGTGDAAVQAAPTEQVALESLQAQPYIVGEDTEKREENVKYFRQSDGSYIAATYAQPVHFEEDGEWREIDNTLIEAPAVAAGQSAVPYLQNRAGSVGIQVPQAAGSPVVVEQDGYTVRFTLQGQQAVEATVTQPEESRMEQLEAKAQQLLQVAESAEMAESERVALSGLRQSLERQGVLAEAAAEAAVVTLDPDIAAMDAAAVFEAVQNEWMKVPQLSSQVSYEDALPGGVDVSYALTGTGIKESLILPGIPATESYTFEIACGALAPALLSDGRVELRDSEGNVRFEIASPVMWDAAGATSSEIEVALAETEGGYLYTLTPSRAWLAEENRVYPVTLDPTIETAGTRADTTDVTVSMDTTADALLNYYANGNSSELNYLRVGGQDYDGKGGEMGSMIRITLPSEITSSCRVVEATLNLACYSRAGGTSDLQISAHTITGDWEPEATSGARHYMVLSSHRPTYDTTVLDTVVLKSAWMTSQIRGRFATWDVTGAVQEWTVDSTKNHGILLKRANASDAVQVAAFNNSQHGMYDDDNPQFVITYRDTKGVEDYWTYTALDAGVNGVAAVNNYTGNLVVLQEVASAAGERMPVDIQLVWNNSGFSNADRAVGTNWRTNYHLTLTAVPSSSPLYEAGYLYYLTDADGTDHYFQFERAGTIFANTGEDEDNLGYKLNHTTRTITDSSGGKMVFNSSGNLSQIQDANGNSVTITFMGTADTRISKITDGAGRVYTFTYSGSTGLLSSVKRPDGQSVTFTHSDGKLTKITYPDGASTSLIYGSAGNLIYVVDDQTSLRANISYYPYSGDSDSQRVRYLYDMYYPGSTSPSFRQSISFTYAHNETTVEELYMDRSLTYQFDNQGHTVGVVDNHTGSAEYASYGQMGGVDVDATHRVLSASEMQQSVTNYLTDFLGNSRADWATYGSGGSYPTVSISTSKYRSGPSSIQLTKSTTASAINILGQDVTGLEAGTYTISGYVNTNGATLSGGAGVKLYAEVVNSAGTLERRGDSARVTHTASGGWERMTCTVDVLAGEKLRVFVGFTDGTHGTVYLDDLQVEKGEVANPVNLLENAALQDGGSGWQTQTGNAATVSGGELVVTPDINQPKTAKQLVTISGKKGDVFSFGGWGRAYAANPHKGVPENSLDDLYNTLRHDPEFGIQVRFYNSSASPVGDPQQIPFNWAVGSDQFIAGQAIAPANYSYVQFEFVYAYNVNTAYFTKGFLYRESFGQVYAYDKDGNLVGATALDQTETELAYQNQQLSKIETPDGAKTFSTTDEKNNPIYTLSTDGTFVENTYDTAGNLLSSESKALTFATSIGTGASYYLINAEAGAALGKSADGYAQAQKWDPEDEWQQFRFERVSGNTYQIIPVADSNYRMTNYSNASTRFAGQNSVPPSGLSYTFTYDEESRAFYIQYISDYVDGCPAGSADTINCNIKTAEKDEDRASQKWYLLRVPSGTETHMETSQTYTSDKNLVASQRDERGNAESYTYTGSTGLMTRSIDRRGYPTTYQYDVMGRLTKVTEGSLSAGFTYEDGLLTGLETATDEAYTFEYDKFGNNTEIGVGDVTLVTRSFNNRGLPTEVDYANGGEVAYTYDGLDRLTQVRYDGSVSPSYEYSYNSNGNLGLVKDHENDQRTRYVYDASGNLVSVRTVSGADGDDGTAKVSLDYSYSSETGQLTGESTRLQNGAAVEMGYTYRPQDGKLNEIYRDGTKEIVYSYTTLDRLYTRTLYLTNGNAKTTTYLYLMNSDGSTTPYVLTMHNGSQTYGYTYDENGNILTVTIDGVLKYTYEYDRYNRLTKEIDRTGSAAVTRTYTYDSNGNRLTKAVSGGQSSTETYTYAATNGWKDQLTSRNGQTFTYDASGNPLRYYGYVMSWENGRQLSGFTGGISPVSYEYNDSGIRTKKTVGSTVTEYFVEGGLLLGQKTGSNVMQFLYEGGSIYGFLYNGTPYYYQFNGQGDVVSVLNGAGTTVATYLYDAWGNLTSSSGSMADTNPIRYRGYYYDIESGFYYLQSRYYDPKTGRFINADSQINADMSGTNLYAYCGNNPVVRSDPTGRSFSEWWELFKQYMSGVLVTAGGVSQVDTPAPGIADLAAGAIFVVGALVCVGAAAYQSSKSVSVEDEKVSTEQSNPPTLIYRYGGRNPGNFIPSRNDVNTNTGLSFSTVPKPGAVITTIEALNATGVVHAVQDGATHVSVYPIGATVAEWREAGTNSIWTIAVKSTIIGVVGL